MKKKVSQEVRTQHVLCTIRICWKYLCIYIVVGDLVKKQRAIVNITKNGFFIFVACQWAKHKEIQLWFLFNKTKYGKTNNNPFDFVPKLFLLIKNQKEYCFNHILLNLTKPRIVFLCFCYTYPGTKWSLIFFQCSCKHCRMGYIFFTWALRKELLLHWWAK